jgi:formylmethanofuran dehydrogenase subunit B
MTDIIEVPSPFCGIGTDDLTVRVDGLNIAVLENGCAVNTPAFELPLGDISPQVRGEKVSLAVAIAQAAALLTNTHQPVIGGCATDVNGMRALLSLADKTGAVVDNANFTAARNNFLALQDSGWMNCTLAEVKNRCDLLVVVGTDLEAFAPRFFERYIWTDAMFTEKRRVIYLGKAPSGNASTSPSGETATVLECATNDLPEVLAVLRALVKGQIVHASSVAGLPVSELQALADSLKAATYGVVTWGAAALSFSQAELTVQMLSEMIKNLNVATRCSGLPLGGKEGDQTANQVCGWTTGYPARVNFAKGYPEYDPFLYDSKAMVTNGEADALVWVNAFNINATPPVSDLPTIVIARAGMTFTQQPTVFIPVGTPSIDHTGHAYRMDNVVAIRLKKLRDSGLPSTAEVLQAIEQAL